MRHYKKKQNTYKNKRYKYKFSPVNNLHDYISNYKKSVAKEASFSVPYAEGSNIIRYSNDEGPYGEAYGVYSDFFGLDAGLKAEYKFKNNFIPLNIKSFVPKKYKYFSTTHNQYLFNNKLSKLMKDQISNEIYDYKKKFPKTKYYSHYSFYSKYWFYVFLKMKSISIRNIKCFFLKKQYKNKKYVFNKWNINNFSKFLFYMKHTNENNSCNLFLNFAFFHNDYRTPYLIHKTNEYKGQLPFSSWMIQKNRKIISSYYFRFKRLLYIDTFINYLKPNVLIIPQEELSSNNYRKSKKYLMKQKPKLNTLTSKKYDKNIPIYFIKKNILKGLFRNVLKFLKVKRYNFSFYRNRKSYLLKELGKRWLIQNKMKRLYKWKNFNKYKFFSHMLIVKKFYDCFYVIKNVINWYTLKHIYIKRPPLYRSKNKYLDALIIKTMPLSKHRYLINKKYKQRRNKRVSFKKKLSSWQKIKYYNYLYWYNYNFKYNLKNISLLIKCYNGSHISKKKKHTYSQFLPFLLRKKNILRYNCLFRIFSKKKDYSTYHYFYSKKLSKLHLLYLNNRPNFFFTSLFKDISLLFYDKYLDYNYTDHIDEKYSFYLKNIFLSRVSKDIRSKFKLNTFSWFKTKKKSISNFLFILKFKYHWNYKKINFFLFFNTYYMINSYKKYFYTYNLIKYYTFILKNNLFSFFKDFFIHKYKVSIYRYWLEKKVIKKEDYSFLDVFYIRYNNEYFGKNELKMKRSLRKIIIIDSIFENNYIDWFFFIFKSVKSIKKTFFRSYNKSYNYLYKKKIPFIKRKCFLKQIIFNSFEKNKSNFYKFFKKLLFFLSKNYKRTFKSNKVTKKDLLWLWSFYKKRFLNCFRHSYEIGFEKMDYYDKNKIYKPLKKKKKRKRELLDHFFKVKKKKKKKKKKLSMTYMLSKNLSHINRLIGSRKFNNKKFNYYFESIKKNNLFKKNTIVSYFSRFKPSFVWSCYSNHKKISLSFKFYIIHYLYNLNNNFLKYYSKIKIFLKYYYIFNFLNFRDYFFNIFLRRKRNRNFLKIKNLSNKRSTNKSYRYLWYREWWYYFTLSEYSNIFIVFFSYLKKLIFYIYLNNTFSTYKDKIIIYSFKNNEFLLRNNFFQYDYFIRNFLNIEVDEIIKYNN